ncbi:15874_t:CDS:2, partial [Racocetra persica]
ECPACGEEAEIDDGLIREKETYLEKKQRIATKKMIRKVIPAEINYQIIFPQKSSVHKDKGQIKEKYVISIPRKTFFLPRDDFVDTALAHEPIHPLIWEDGHGRE